MNTPTRDLGPNPMLIFKIQESAIIGNSGSTAADIYVTGLIEKPSIALKEIKEQIEGGAEDQIRTMLGHKCVNYIKEYLGLKESYINPVLAQCLAPFIKHIS